MQAVPHQFPALPDWECALQFIKQSYGSHLYLFLYLHSTVVVHLPVPEEDLQPCVFTRVTCESKISKICYKLTIYVFTISEKHWSLKREIQQTLVTVVVDGVYVKCLVKSPVLDIHLYQKKWEENISMPRKKRIKKSTFSLELVLNQWKSILWSQGKWQHTGCGIYGVLSIFRVKYKFEKRGWDIALVLCVINMNKIFSFISKEVYLISQNFLTEIIEFFLWRVSLTCMWSNNFYFIDLSLFSYVLIWKSCEIINWLYMYRLRHSGGLVCQGRDMVVWLQSCNCRSAVNKVI